MSFISRIFYCKLDGASKMAGSKETETVSTSLIRTTPRIPLSSEDKTNFCLGMVGWCPCDDCQSVAKKPVEESVTNGVKTVKKSLKLKRKQDSANELTKLFRAM